MEAPKKIYLQPSAIEQLPHQNIVYTKPLAYNSIEYTRTDAFIEKAKEFLWSHIEGSDFHVNYVFNEFEKYMKGE